MSHTLRTGALAAALILAAGCKPAPPDAASESARSDAAPAAAAAEAPPATPAAPATPTEGVKAALGKFLEVKSYRAQMIDVPTGKTTATLEYVAPDRFRISMAGGPQQVFIGRTAYFTLNGKTTKTDLAENMPTPRESSEKALQTLDTAQVTAAGEDTIGGEPADVYLAVMTQPAGESKTWVSKRTGLPLQSETKASAAGITMHNRLVYTDYDDASIKIEPPQ